MLSAISSLHRRSRRLAMKFLDCLTNHRCNNRPHSGHAPDKHLDLGRQLSSRFATAVTSRAVAAHFRRNLTRRSRSSTALLHAGSFSHICSRRRGSSLATTFIIHGFTVDVLSIFTVIFSSIIIGSGTRTSCPAITIYKKHKEPEPPRQWILSIFWPLKSIFWV
jgi:hypothetical protein